MPSLPPCPPGRVHLTYSEPRRVRGTRTSPPRCLPDRAAAEQLQDAHRARWTRRAGSAHLDGHSVHMPGGVVNRPAEPSAFAVVLAGIPELVAALLRDHTPDERGLCRACGLPGTGTPHVTAPCALARIAEAARQLRMRPSR